MAKAGDKDRTKAEQLRAPQPADWRESLLRFPFFMLPPIAPLLLFACVSFCYMASVAIVFERILSAFEVHFILILMILLVIYAGFFSIVQRRAHGRWGVVRGAAAVWAGALVMLFGIFLLVYYLAVVMGLL
jgi:hypothetical protein